MLVLIWFWKQHIKFPFSRRLLNKTNLKDDTHFNLFKFKKIVCFRQKIIVMLFYIFNCFKDVLAAKGKDLEIGSQIIDVPLILIFYKILT